MPPETFEDFFAQVKRIAVEEYGYTPEAAESFDPVAWEAYFGTAKDPRIALAEDAAHADG